jgi:hypothetical protein
MEFVANTLEFRHWCFVKNLRIKSLRCKAISKAPFAIAYGQRISRRDTQAEKAVGHSQQRSPRARRVEPPARVCRKTIKLPGTRVMCCATRFVNRSKSELSSKRAVQVNLCPLGF